MENGPHVFLHSFGRYEVYIKIDRAAKEHASCPIYQQESCEWLPFVRDGYKIVLESNKLFMSKHSVGGP